MGEITRYSLYRLAGELFTSEANKYNFGSWRVALGNAFLESSNLILGMESSIKNDKSRNNDFSRLFEDNMLKIKSTSLWSFVNANKVKVKFPKIKSNVNLFPYQFTKLLRIINDYQEELIVKEMNSINEMAKSFVSLSGESCYSPKTFLSYAYVDKGLTLALFFYFLKHGGFLYVNWMWSPACNNGVRVKNDLNNNLSNSIQLLLLRTPNSELEIKGNYTVRQWCSWEIGNFYSKRPNKEFYVSFYDKSAPKNEFLDGICPMRGVNQGVIV